MKRPVFFFIIALLFLPNPCLSDEALSSGASAPKILARDLQGNIFRSSQLMGKPLLLNFFSTSCMPCRDEIPLLAEIGKEYADRMAVALIAPIPEDTLEKIQRFIGMLPAYPPLVLKTDTAIIMKNYQVEAFPTTFLINKEGIIFNSYLGCTPESIEQLILLRQINGCFYINIFTKYNEI